MTANNFEEHHSNFVFRKPQKQQYVQLFQSTLSGKKNRGKVTKNLASDPIFPRFLLTRLVLLPNFFLLDFFTRFLPDFFTRQGWLMTRKTKTTKTVHDDDEEFVCVNDENDLIILEFSVIVVENITWI